MNTRRRSPVVLTTMLFALAACSDSPLAPGTAATPADARKPTLAVVLPDVGDEVVVGILAPRQQTRADLPDGTSQTVLLSESMRLFASGRATGVLHLTSDGIPEIEGAWIAEHGRVECVDGAAEFTVVLRSTGRSSHGGEAIRTHDHSGEHMSLSFNPIKTGPRGYRWLNVLRSAERDELSFEVQGRLDPFHDPCPGSSPAPSAPAAERVADGKYVVTSTTHGPVPLHLDGQQGTAMIQVAAAVGGSVNGDMSIGIGGSRTQYLVRDGELRREGDGYHWVLRGLAIETRSGPAIHRPFSSELVLRSGETFADDDIWIIDDLVCFYDQGELICS